MASTQPKQTLNVHCAIEGPLNMQKLMTGRADPTADLGVLATVDCDLFAIVNSIQSSRLALAKVSQQGAARDKAYLHELHKNRRMSKEIQQLYGAIESVHKTLLEANMMNGDLYNRMVYLKSMLDELEQLADQGPVRQNMKTLQDLFTEEKRKIMVEHEEEKAEMMLEHREALKDAERRVQEAEQRAVYGATAPVKVQGRSGVACIAGAEGEPSALGNSHFRTGSESNNQKSSSCYPHQGQISSGVNDKGPKLRRQRRMKLPPLEIAKPNA